MNFNVLKLLTMLAQVLTIGHPIPALAQDASGREEDKGSAGQEAASPHQGGLSERDVLTGDWGGLRTRLEAGGLTFGVNSIDETLSGVTGGTTRGTIYEGRTEMLVTADLGELIGWTGATFHANAHQIRGRGLSANYLANNFMPPSSIEAVQTTRLFDLWLQQDLFDGALSVRAGQLAADDEFITTLNGAVLMNDTFGWPSGMVVDLPPGGGPAYPMAAPGIRFRAAATGELSVMLAVFDADPAGRGTQKPQVRNGSGTAFRLNDGAFVLGEADYAVNKEQDAAGLPGTYKLGFFYSSADFPDQRTNPNGPPVRNGNYGAYAVIDQMAWRAPGTTDQGLGFFLRVIGAPADRNLLDFYLDGGASYKGPFAGRENDVLGLGFAYARVGNAARRFDVTRGWSVADFEADLEITYRAQILPWWTLQPDAQFLFHPGGTVTNPRDPSGRLVVPDASILGLRSTIAF